MKKPIHEMTTDEIIAFCDAREENKACMTCPLYYKEICALDMVYDTQKPLKDLFDFLSKEVDA